MCNDAHVHRHEMRVYTEHGMIWKKASFEDKQRTLSKNHNRVDDGLDDGHYEHAQILLDGISKSSPIQIHYYLSTLWEYSFQTISWFTRLNQSIKLPKLVHFNSSTSFRIQTNSKTFQALFIAKWFHRMLPRQLLECFSFRLNKQLRPGPKLSGWNVWIQARRH